MAYPGKEIYNTKTGQQITFIRTAQMTAGKLLEMESRFSTGSSEPAPHYHPLQQETFHVLSGEISVRIDGEVHTIKEGQRFEILPGTVHSMWNHSAEEAVLNWRVHPALDTEFFLETAFGVANHHDTDERGMPDILQVAVLANRYSLVFRLAQPSYLLQKLIFFLLTPLAYLKGYRSRYPQFIN